MVTRSLFFLVAAIVVCAIGALLAFSVFGTATVAQLFGLAFIGVGCLAASFVP